MENANTDVGCKGLLLQMWPLLRSDLEKKNIFLCGQRNQVINICKGHITNYTRVGSC